VPSGLRWLWGKDVAGSIIRTTQKTTSETQTSLNGKLGGRQWGLKSGGLQRELHVYISVTRVLGVGASRTFAPEHA